MPLIHSVPKKISHFALLCPTKWEIFFGTPCISPLTQCGSSPFLLHVLPVSALELTGVEGVEGLVDADLLGLDGHLVGQRL